MSRKSDFKQTQVDGKKYALPKEEVKIEKLIRKGLVLELKAKDIMEELEAVKKRITEIARKRRGGATTVNLKGISGSSVITFREGYVSDEHVEEIKRELGSLFERFFIRKIDFKTTKELKAFLDGENNLGLSDPVSIKKLLAHHVTKKETKPNVKLVPGD